MKPLLLAFAFLSLPGLARAEKVKLDIKVVEASTQGKALDPRLKHMERDFKQNGFAFSSYKLVSEQEPTLNMKATASVPLPNGKTAQLTPTGTSGGPKNKSINMRVTIPTIGYDESYSAVNHGTHFLGFGPAGKNQVFLVVTHTLQ